MLSNQTGFPVERASMVEADANKLVYEITVSGCAQAPSTPSRLRQP